MSFYNVVSQTFFYVRTHNNIFKHCKFSLYANIRRKYFIRVDQMHAQECFTNIFLYKKDEEILQVYFAQQSRLIDFQRLLYEIMEIFAQNTVNIYATHTSII